ncbi:MAG: hypothetical protein ACW99A_14035 [Candidatus Kariarchaeaceae archaeon]|jgi:hypothetical protein
MIKTQTQTSGNLNFENEMRSFFDEIYPEFTFPEAYQNQINKGNSFSSRLIEIYDEREKYNLHWAIKQVEESLKLISVKIATREHTFEHSSEYEKQTADMREKMTGHINRTSKLYSGLSIGISVVDIVVSVLLILVVTLIAQFGESLLESMYLILFIAIIALIKVSLDRFFIIPRIERWGWSRYLHLTEDVMKRMAKLSVIRIIYEEVIKKSESKDTIRELVTRGVKEIS